MKLAYKHSLTVILWSRCRRTRYFNLYCSNYNYNINITINNKVKEVDRGSQEQGVLQLYLQTIVYYKLGKNSILIITLYIIHIKLIAFNLLTLMTMSCTRLIKADNSKIKIILSWKNKNKNKNINIH